MFNNFQLQLVLAFIGMLAIHGAVSETVSDDDAFASEQSSLQSAPSSSLPGAWQGDSLPAHKDSLIGSQGRAGTQDSSILVMHRFHHREQVIVGGTVMACITLILVTMNNYNPR